MTAIPADDASVIAWVREQLTALDESPRNRYWRRKALGMTRGEAIGQLDMLTTLDLHLPVGEMRMLNDAARTRGMSPTMFAKCCIGTILAACEGIDPAAVPTLTKGGLIGPGE